MAQVAAGFTKAARLEREKRLRRRATLIAVTSTLAVILTVVILVPMAPGWEKVQRSFFNWEIFQKTFPKLVRAFLLDVAIFAWSAPIIAV